MKYGAPNASIAAAACSGVVHTYARPVGTSAPAITSLANALEPSIRAACADGPNTATTASRNGSATPATSGASGPTTTRSTASSRASATTAPLSAISTGRHSATDAIPGLPGAAYTCSTSGSRVNAQASACSRPPVPSTRTFTAPEPIGSRPDTTAGPDVRVME